MCGWTGGYIYGISKILDEVIRSAIKEGKQQTHSSYINHVLENEWTNW